MSDQFERLKDAIADRYAIERELGSGGMATVYLAEDLKHERQVAVKVMRPEVAAALGADRFLREIKIAAKLNHPHILPLHDSGEAQGFLYYVMPYVDGETLRDRLNREKQLPLDDALLIAREVADGLSYAHSHEVVHRDIKPENVLLEAGHAVLADFGIARAISVAGEQRLTETGLAIGTPAYMSPEQGAASQDVDGRSDVYSLACVLYEMLAGQPPFTGATAESVIHQHLTANLKSVTDLRAAVPSEVAKALEKALAKTPADRFTTAQQFAEALRLAPTAGQRERAATSIAVLPFANMSADPENEFFTDGITEDIINALTKVPELRVASRTSAFAFKGKGQDIRRIGEQLNVGTVLEGSVRRVANRLRITAQLIGTTDGYHLWSERYDRELDDVFAVQDEISRAIVSTLKIKLTSPKHMALAKRQTENLEAYNLYLKGRFFWNRRGEGLAKAREYFTQAIELDPDYAHAHTALADTHNLLGWYRVLAPSQAFPEAKTAALRALEIDETLAQAHASLAFALTYYDWAWAKAEQEFKRAIELNPGYATTHHWYSEYLMVVGQTGEAIREAERAQELDPLGLIINVVVAMAYYFARKYARAIQECERTIEMDPTFTPAYVWLAPAYVQEGMYEDAISVCQTEISLSPSHPVTLPFLARAYALRGKKDEAEGVLSELQTRAENTFASSADIALTHFSLGNTETGFEWLEKACQERAVWLAFLKVDPMLDGVRHDERFQRLLKHMALG